MSSVRVEVLEDGTLHYISDGHVVVTGPVSGTVVVDGETVNVTPAVIAVDSPETAIKVADAIGEKLQAEGHPAFLADPNVPNDGFVHIPSEG